VASPYVFVYLPKTGSSPLLSHLAEHLVWNEGIVYLGPWGDRQRQRQWRPDMSVWTPAKCRLIRVITGSHIDTSSHEITGADHGHYFTVLRDPADRWVAEYNAFMDRGDDLPGFWDWYGARRVNQTTRRFRELFGVETADEISDRLKDFWFVTTTEHLAEDSPYLLREIGVPNDLAADGDSEGDLDDVDAAVNGDIGATVTASDSHIVMTEEIKERVYADHPKDRRLHELALRRRASKRTFYGWD